MSFIKKFFRFILVSMISIFVLCILGTWLNWIYTELVENYERFNYLGYYYTFAIAIVILGISVLFFWGLVTLEEGKKLYKKILCLMFITISSFVVFASFREETYVLNQLQVGNIYPFLGFSVISIIIFIGLMVLALVFGCIEKFQSNMKNMEGKCPACGENLTELFASVEKVNGIKYHKRCVVNT